VGEDVIAALPHFGLSGICNVLAAIKTAKALGLGASDALITVATDGAALYTSEIAKAMSKHFAGVFGATEAVRTFETHLTQASAQHVLPMGEVERNRIFNLGYFTWVEQRGVALADFEARRDQAFWQGLHSLLPQWDAMIGEFNHKTGAA
jgi:phosphopantothenate synthetase